MNLNDLIGKPFQSKARGPDAYDCWGLTIEVYRRFGIILPDYSIAAEAVKQVARQIKHEKIAGNWKQLENPETPCIILFKCHPEFLQHFGVYVGAGKFIHVRREDTKGVVINRLDDPLWIKREKEFWQWKNG